LSSGIKIIYINHEKENTMKIAVTGGAGFIGSHLVEKLAESGHDITIIDNLDPLYDPKIKRKNIEEIFKKYNVTFLEEDIINKPEMEKIFKRNKFEKIIHLAAKAGIRQSLEDPINYSRINIQGTINLLEMAKTYNIEHFVFASSSSVYGEGIKSPFQEFETNLNPISIYASTKVAGELLCKNYSILYNINITCLRFFTAYGPRQRPEMAIHKFTRKLFKGEPFEVFGEGKLERDFTYIDDIVHGITLSLNKMYKFEIFNLGRGKKIDLNHVIKLLQDYSGKKGKILYKPVPKGDVPLTYADISKAQKMLGYHPSTNIEDGIREFMIWFKEKRNN